MYRGVLCDWTLILTVTCLFVAGRSTTNDELEDMLESGDSAIFTQGVRFTVSHLKQNR